MNEQNNNRNEDTYDLLHKNFSLFGDDTPAGAEESDVKNSGEIYFSAQPVNTNKSSSADFNFDRFESPTAKTGVSFSSDKVISLPKNNITVQKSNLTSSVKTNAPAKNTPAAKPKTAQTKPTNTAKNTSKKKYAKKQNSTMSLLLAGGIVVFVLVASLIIRIPVMGCVSDILAIDRDSTEIRVVLEENMTTKQVIKILGQKNLIYSTGFCKAISGFLGYDSDEIFPAGTYDLSADMGLEGMLRAIMSAGASDETVTVTFPEGYTVDQIIEKLAQNGVASINALYAALDDETLYAEYDFLAGITDKEQRYRALEGYLYPDTYEFYIDENPTSVFKRFLNNFRDKWEDKFADEYEGSGYTIDEIITVASIIQKEANDSEQMSLIASIIYNRLNSSSFPWLNCDSTANYIEQNREALEEAGTYVNYLKQYDTYQVTGLPVGPICNPSYEAIAAAINPDNTDYYYFLHDKTGKIYTARTEAEHLANKQYMDNAG